MDNEAHFDGRRVQEAGVVVASATVGVDYGSRWGGDERLTRSPKKGEGDSPQHLRDEAPQRRLRVGCWFNAMIGESYTRWRVIGVVQYTPINDHRRAYWLDHQLSDGGAS